MSDDALSCLILPCGQSQLLLPSVNVIEITSQSVITPLTEDREGVLGSVHWRQQDVTVIDVEQLLHQLSIKCESLPYLAICNTIGNSSNNLMAIALQTLARTITIAPGDLSLVEHPANPYIKKCVMINEEQLIIPDLLALEKDVC